MKEDTKFDFLLMGGTMLVCSIYLAGKIWLDDTVKAERKAENRSLHEQFYDRKEMLSYGQKERDSEAEIVDRFTGQKYRVVRETMRNPWDRLPYDIATSNLVLRKIEKAPQPEKQPFIF